MGKKYIRYLYDKNMYPEFSQRLKEARKNKKLSQQNVADQIGCSRTLYQQMENGGASAIQHAHELGNEPSQREDHILSAFERSDRHNLPRHGNH